MLVAFLRASTTSLESTNLPTKTPFALDQNLCALAVGGILPNHIHIVAVWGFIVNELINNKIKIFVFHSFLE